VTWRVEDFQQFRRSFPGYTMGDAGAAGARYAHTIRVISPEVLEFPIMVSCLTMAVVERK